MSPGSNLATPRGSVFPKNLQYKQPCHSKEKTCRNFQLDRISIILKKNNTKASPVQALGLYNITFKHCLLVYENVQIGNDQEKAQPEKDSHSKNRGGKKLD